MAKTSHAGAGFCLYTLCMRWAVRRQFIYATAVLAVIALAILAGYSAFFYQAPSCSDKAQNQREEGIDCGGPCASLCTAPQVSALWTRAVEIAPGVYHAVALVQNPRTDAGTNALPYAFSLYDGSGILVAERSGVMYLDPGEIVPLLEPNVVTQNRIPARAFVSFGAALWQKEARTDMPVRVVSQSLDSQALRLTAHLANTNALPAPAFTVTAFLYDAGDNLVTASETQADGLPARGEKDIVFTWQEPFSAPVVRADIIPRFSSPQR